MAHSETQSENDKAAVESTKALGGIVFVLFTAFLGVLLASWGLQTPKADVSISMPVQEPPMWQIENFVSAKECAELIELGTPGLVPSPKSKQTMQRNSYTKGFEIGESSVIDGIAKRAGALILNLTKSLQSQGRSAGSTALDEVLHAPHITEVVQFTRYRPGETFAAHMDSRFIMSEEHQRDYPDAPRLATVVIFLDSPEAGGELVFPNIVSNGTDYVRLAGRSLMVPAYSRKKCEKLSPGCTAEDMEHLYELEKQHMRHWKSSRGTMDCCCEGAKKFTPIAGRAVMFLPLWREGEGDDLDFSLIHAGCDVAEGMLKHILQIWFRHQGPLPRGTAGHPAAKGQEL